MKSNIIIPELIKAGFQERTDTYSKKLAYVIYKDKNKWRKEPSWESWRTKQITDEEFEQKKLEDFHLKRKQGVEQFKRIQEHLIKDPNYQYYQKYKFFTEEQYLKEAKLDNVQNHSYYLNFHSNDISLAPVELKNEPIEGFVLNKEVGGVSHYSHSWDQRTEKVRIYDPRGFEFEITIPNLLYILQNTSSIKGKGIEGKMVYGWDSKDLVLIPEGAPEFQEMVKFTQLQTGKVLKKDLIVGGIYLNNNAKKIVYLGEFDFYNYSSVKVGKKLFFYNLEGNYIVTEKTANLKQYTGEQVIDMSEMFDRLEKDTNYKPSSVKILFYIPLTVEESKKCFDSRSYSYEELYIKIKDKYKRVYKYSNGGYDYKTSEYKYKYALKKGYRSDNFITPEYDTVNELITNHQLYKQEIK